MLVRPNFLKSLGVMRKRIERRPKDILTLPADSYVHKACLPACPPARPPVFVHVSRQRKSAPSTLQLINPLVWIPTVITKHQHICKLCHIDYTVFSFIPCPQTSTVSQQLAYCSQQMEYLFCAPPRCHPHRWVSKDLHSWCAKYCLPSSIADLALEIFVRFFTITSRVGQL